MNPVVFVRQSSMTPDKARRLGKLGIAVCGVADAAFGEMVSVVRTCYSESVKRVNNTFCYAMLPNDWQTEIESLIQEGGNLYRQ